MSLEISSLCIRCSAVSTGEWPLAQMNCVHVLLQIRVQTEELPTCDALERLLLEVYELVVILHVVPARKRFAAG